MGFDSVLAELNAKLAAAMTVIAEHPELAEKVAKAIDTAPVKAVTDDEVLQDQARANALAVALRDARKSLPVPEPEEPAGPAPKKTSGDRKK